MPKAPGAPAAKATAPATQAPAPVQDEIPDDGWFVTMDETEDFANAVFYGREGSGKTTAAVRMVNLRPTGKVLVINAEGGLKQVALKKRGVDTSRLAVWPDPKSGQRFSHTGLNQVYNRLKADLTADPESWIGVVIDSATEVHTAILDTVQQKRVAAIRASGKVADDDFVDISDYGTMSKLFRDLLRKFRDLPCHLVITALERRTVDKDTGKPSYGPAVTPGLQTDLLGYVDFVLMLKAADEDGPYRALCRANSRYRAKDRYDVLPRVLAEPMFDRLIGYRDGTLDADTDPFQDDLTATAKTSQDAIPLATPDESEGDEADDESAKSED